MGFRFSLVLSRKITKGETTALKRAGCKQAGFGTGSLPTDAGVPVTRLEFDDTSSPTLAEAIESALAAVRTVPDLGVPALTVPAQPAAREDAAEAEAEAEAVKA
ncbi:MAG TPA: hypothetical protein VGM10_32915 [Actinocrinis sp.]|jgi:hypothetical protein